MTAVAVPLSAGRARVSAEALPAPLVAAVTLGRDGGGIAAVSRMIWQVASETWAESRLVTLVDAPDGHEASPRPGLASRVRFGAELWRRQAAGERPWVLFSHLALARAQAFLPRSVRRPYAVFLHGIEAWRPLPPAARRAVNGAALLLANSHFTAARVRAANAGLGPIQVCPLALTAGQIGTAVTDDGHARRRAGRPLVLMLGRLSAAERYKGHDQMIEAWPAVRASVPAARLCIAGGGDDLDRLERKTRQLGLADVVEFTGFVSDQERARLYDAAWVFAMPSEGEGFGLVYLEAMARELPCIASRQDAAGEVVEDGVTGHLVNQSDVQELSARVAGLLTDEATRQRMGQAARARVCRLYGYPQFRDRLLSLLASARDRLTGEGA